MGNRIYLASPTMHQEEQVFIQEAFDTNWVAPLGKNVDEFEKGVAEFVGVKSAAALNAGTAALHLAVKLAGVRRGDKVFCSDLTFSATVNPVSYEGGEQVFIDSERETWNMDPRALERAFERYPDCRCVIAANLYGTPAKLDEIGDICDAHGAVFIPLETLVSPEVYLDEFDTLHPGCVLTEGTILGGNNTFGLCSYVNLGCQIGHNTSLGDFSMLSPGCIVSGEVTIGEDTYIGTGAVIRNQVTIGKNCIIGMGSLVTKDIPDNVVAYGSPCRIVRENTDGKVFR